MTFFTSPGQKALGVQLLAIAIGYLPGIISTIMSLIQNDRRSLTVNNIFLNSTILGGIMIIVMLLLLRYLCGERIRDLNQKEGTWWKDILFGIGLSGVTLASDLLLSNPISRMFPREQQSGLGDFFSTIVQNPWIFALIMGPVLIIGAGVYEELTRVFLLTRLWNISSNQAWKQMAIVLSALVFGITYIYQGPAGAIMAGIYGLIMVVYYLYYGRIAVLMIAHYFHDAVQIAMIYIMPNIAV